MEYAVYAASSDSEVDTDSEEATTALEEERVASKTDQQGPLFEVAAESTGDAQGSSGCTFINKAAPTRKSWDSLDALKVEVGEKPNHKGQIDWAALAQAWIAQREATATEVVGQPTRVPNGQDIPPVKADISNHGNFQSDPNFNRMWQPEFGIHQKQKAGRSDVQIKKRNFTEDGQGQPSKLVKRSEQPQKKQIPCTSRECGENTTDLTRWQGSESFPARNLADICAPEESVNCTQSTQKVHVQVEGYKFPECSTKYKNTTQLHQHLNAHNKEKPIKCPECKKGFKSEYDLLQHQLVHVLVEKYKCPECNTICKNATQLHQHWNAHYKEKPIKCPKCEKDFNSAHSLLEHQVMIHNVEKPFQCTDCNLKFISSFGLNQHQSLVHTAKGNFECLECNRCFTYSHRLLMHQDAKHNVQKPFQCKECNLKFMTESHLNEHILTHIRTYNCPKCRSIFISSLLVDLHLHIAHGSKDSFKCPDCSERFYEADRMMQHRLVIHNIQEYLSCAHCPIMFNSLEQLRKHQVACNEGVSIPVQQKVD